MSRCTISKSIDKKLEKAQHRLMKLKLKYDAAAAEVEMLIKRRDELKRKELLDTFVASGKSYEEVLSFLRTKSRGKDSTEEDEENE